MHKKHQLKCVVHLPMQLVLLSIMYLWGNKTDLGIGPGGMGMGIGNFCTFFLFHAADVFPFKSY
jgi:hypothetical protein